MTILSAHTQRIIFHKIRSAAHLISAEHACEVSDVFDIAVGGMLTASEEINRYASNSGRFDPHACPKEITPSQPGETSRSHAPAAQTDGEGLPNLPPSPPVAPEPESRSTRSRLPGSGDFLGAQE
jgi:hypothetical protein